MPGDGPPNDDLSRLFSPRSIALVGASGDRTALSGRPYRYLRAHGYDGDLYLVNPNRDRIDGRRCYDAVDEIDRDVDLALVLVPAEVVSTVVEDCGRAGVPFAVVVASGFAETGAAGRERQAELLRTARDHGVRLVGPNSEGFVNVADGVAASFSSILRREELRAGNVGFVTQSGGFGGALFQLCQDRGIGASTWVSTGNEVDVDTLDVLAHLVEDPGTDVVATYVESVDDGRRLLSIGRRAAETRTAIVAMRVGASARGGEAAASHTGSIATSDAVYDAVFRQTGVTRVRSVDEFLDTVAAFSRLDPAAYPSPGGGLGVVSISGGAAVLVADTCAAEGVPLATLAAETEAAIAAEIPAYGSATNPLDVTAAAMSEHAVFERCVHGVAGDPGVNALLVQFGNSGREMIEGFADDLRSLADEGDVPVVTVFTGSRPRPETAAALRDAGVLVFEDPVRAVRILRWLGERARFLAGADALPEAVSLDSAAEPLPTEWAALSRTLASTGVPFARTVPVETSDAAVEAAGEVGYPVTLKYDPLAVEHKAERDGVRTGLADAEAVEAAFEALRGGASPAVVVQPEASGLEVIVGVVDDPDFGPVMAFGPGGVFVELFDEFAYRALPVSPSMAREMIDETPAGRLLDGYRGTRGDRDALASLLVGVSDLYLARDVAELEFNPVFVDEDGAVAVDVLFERRPGGSGQS